MSKINSAESIRGLACMAVVFSHLILTFFPLLHTNLVSDFEKMTSIERWIFNSPFNFWYSGSAAVYIFFVLSGYVLSYAILSKADINKKLLSMALKRYPRLAIPALLSCIIAWVVSFVDVDTSSASKWISNYLNEPYSLIDAIYQGAIGSFLFGSAPINWVLWTMQIELFGSFILFLLLFFYKENLKIFFLLSFILPLPAILVSTHFFFGVYSFIIGIYLFLYGKNIPLYLALPSLIIGLYFAGVHNLSASYGLFNNILGNKSYLLLNFISGALICFGVLMHPRVSEILDKKPLILLGKLSFSIYLLHMIMIYILGIPFFNIALNYGFSYLTSAFFSSTLIIISTIFLSYFYSKYVDDFSIKVAAMIEKKVVK